MNDEEITQAIDASENRLLAAMLSRSGGLISLPYAGQEVWRWASEHIMLPVHCTGTNVWQLRNNCVYERWMVTRRNPKSNAIVVVPCKVEINGCVQLDGVGPEGLNMYKSAYARVKYNVPTIDFKNQDEYFLDTIYWVAMR